MDRNDDKATQAREDAARRRREAAEARGTALPPASPETGTVQR